MVRACVLQKKSIENALKVPEIKSFTDLLEHYDIVYMYPIKTTNPEEVFENGNGIGRDIQSKLKYSLSVGDIVGFFERGKFVKLYLCMPVGWKEVCV